MKNKILYFFIFFLINFTYFSAVISEEFNFDITEIEIVDDGNTIIGSKNGIVKTNNGVVISANTFVYNKLTNILTANGNVKIIDSNRKLEIYSDIAIYEKNKEILITNQNSKAIYDLDKLIFADSLKFDRNKNILTAKGNVKIKDNINDYLITGNDFTYFKNSEKIISDGEVKASVQSKYRITSKDVIYYIKENKLTSEYKTKIEDQNLNIYFTEKFDYQLNQEIFKGEKVLIISNYNLPNSDKFFFKNAIINLKEKKFIGQKTEISIHKSIFNNSKNDPRLKGVSSISDSNITLINKGIFTSCEKNDNCPPWSIKAKKIKHDKTKKQIEYQSAVLKIYDLPVLYFPKFFHPDPSVERQSGLLKPEINSSNILGSSFTIPYFKVISDSKDITITPTLFDSKTLMSSIEYREVKKNSNFLLDVGLVDGYKSPTVNKKKNQSHLFLDYNLDLGLENYILSDFKISVEKVSNDNYLKIFDPYITKSSLRPDNFDKLNANMKIFLNHENYDLELGMESYENLQIKENSDR